MKTKDFIKKYFNDFTKKTRDNGEKFYCLKTDKFRDINMMIHGTDILPDDFRYKTIYNLLSSLLDYIEDHTLDYIKDNCLFDIVDNLVDIYNSDLTKWLSSNLIRIDYVNTANSEYGSSDLITQLRQGQFIEIEEIAFRLIEEIESNCK